MNIEITYTFYKLCLSLTSYSRKYSRVGHKELAKIGFVRGSECMSFSQIGARTKDEGMRRQISQQAMRVWLRRVTEKPCAMSAPARAAAAPMTCSTNAPTREAPRRDLSLATTIAAPRRGFSSLSDGFHSS